MGWLRAASFAALLVAAIGASPVHAVEAVNVRTDVTAIDLTGVIELIKTETDTIQVSTAPGADGIVRRMQESAREGSTNWAVFALSNSGDEQIDRLIVVPHYRMVGSGLLMPDLGLSRIVTITPSSGERPERQIQRHRRHLPHHARPRHRDHLRRGAAHRSDAAALSVGARRLQGQGQQLHALPRHRHRHRRPAGAVPDHPVRGQGQRDVSGGRGARLGGAGLYRHRLRLLGQGVRHVVRRRADLARVGRSDPGRHAAGVPVRLSQSQSLARALRAHHGGLARGLAALVAIALDRRLDRLGHRADVADRYCGARPLPGDLPFDARLRPRRAADPDLVPAGGLDRRRWC